MKFLSRRLVFTASSVVWLLLVSGVARQAGAQQGVAGRFDQLDRNSDGKVTRDELRARAFFERIDVPPLAAPAAARHLPWPYLADHGAALRGVPP